MMKKFLESRDPGELYEMLSYILAESAQRLDEREGLLFLKRIWSDYQKALDSNRENRRIVFIDLDRKIILIEPLLRFLRGVFSACLVRALLGSDDESQGSRNLSDAEIINLHTTLYLMQSPDVGRNVHRLYAYDSIISIGALSRLVKQVVHPDFVRQDFFLFSNSTSGKDGVETKTIVVTGAAMEACIRYGESRFPEITAEA